MNLQELSTFLAVAEYKNFTLAAKSLGLSQSAVSRQIKALEAELQTQLLIRNPRQVMLTEKGHQLLHKARDFKNWIDEDFLQKKVHDLKIGSIEGFLHYWILPRLEKEFFTHWTQLEFVTHSVAKMLDMIQNNELDGCFTTKNVQTELVTSLKVFTERQVLVTTDDQFELKNIHRYPWVIFSNNDPLFTSQKKKSTSITRMNSLRAIYETVAKGHGIAVLPDHLLAQDHNLIVKRPRFIKPTHIYFNTLNKKKMDAHLASFCDLLLAS